MWAAFIFVRALSADDCDLFLGLRRTTNELVDCDPPLTDDS